MTEAKALRASAPSKMVVKGLFFMLVAVTLLVWSSPCPMTFLRCSQGGRMAMKPRMLIHFFGATRTTTGSMYLFEVGGQRLLLECGLFQGKRGESIERNCCFPFDPKELAAVVLSHAHIDHCGNLPNLCRQGFNGDIYCTFATRDLASIMLEDSAEIQRDDAEYISHQRAKKHLPPVEPLYLAADAEKAVRQF